MSSVNQRFITGPILLGCTLLLSACANQVTPVAHQVYPQQTTPAIAPQSVSPAPASAPAQPARTRQIDCSQNLFFPGFPQEYQVQLRNFACALQIKYQLPEQWVLPALYNARFNQRALALMTPPPPSATPPQPYPWWRYRDRFVRADRLQRGVNFWQAHQNVIAQVSGRYGVSPEILMGILNIETGFGTFQGNFPVLDANLSLALGLPARSSFFLYQAAETIRLAHQLGQPVSSLRGSEAGAMGMSQFLASSYLKYGTVWDDPPGDGLPDLWRSVPDVLASTSKFFLGHGWQPGQPVLREATVLNPAQATAFLHGRYPLREIERAGIRPNIATPMPASTQVGLLQLATERGPRFFIAYPNFYAIMGYNPSINYSATVWAYAQALQARLG
ncbi:lytic murein transglycosylase [Acidithiobacillus sp. CV18-2]|uniref:Lytic murein transglycosylase n=1 Tax=Igneacidithiobacillus copahuensis TaxID=2724909 RepID=A0AAE2YSD5_9PROT|nr:lytic murein transglycosylase [Igneacidithiobacillus copahuensis]MBU2753595.1 lytic murein transglycosylase [Acidithiobacillus sp. CV18-3]MBU2757332.1 lytic murein transglycosylase [Acidithiobacillus sp. BN09-2]MBU2776089.1 lytic murein transglycosylase [Acidithiobacillus sp. CV18-2]MBU2795414.1 lytic murein transglycosylase [Acidithiobacillus sp. VAN18-2]MBU2800234.1 lytic murein transglycosylase [Acidithiobacillus sp. VAN18-4]UTV82306.1 lytic murein transglycosylase [Acidithiobacillus sp